MMKRGISHLGAVVIALSLNGCVSQPVADPVSPSGISGQTRFDTDTILVVHDVKNDNDDPRISLVFTS
jgi:hypothetical protein